MKKNALFLIGFLGCLCFSGQSPRKQMDEISTVQYVKSEELEQEKRKSAAKKAMEDTGQTTMKRVGAAKKVVEAEETFR